MYLLPIMPNMSSEKIDPSQLMDRMIEFGEFEGVNQVIVRGPIRSSERLISVAAGLFPSLTEFDEPSYVIVAGEPEGLKGAPHYHSKIMRLQLDQRIIDLNLPDSSKVSKKNTEICRVKGWPIIAIFFGQYSDTNEAFISLACIAGISPQTALDILKKQSQERLISFQ